MKRDKGKVWPFRELLETDEGGIAKTLKSLPTKAGRPGRAEALLLYMERFFTWIFPGIGSGRIPYRR